MPKVIISEFMDEAAIAAELAGLDVQYDPGLVDRPEDLAAAVAQADALIVRNRTQVRGALLDAARDLKVVGRLGVGLDNIDVPACRARGIAVYPATGANDGAVAEYVVATALLLLRGAYGASAAVRPVLAALTARGSALPRRDAWHREARAALAYRPPVWADFRGTGQRLHPVELCRAVDAFLERHPDGTLICDGGEIGQWPQALVRAGRRLINGVSGTIGASIPFAIAAALERPGAPVVAVLGDGTFGFHMAEFDTAVRYRIPFIAVVGNDARWNAEHQIQLRSYGPERTRHCDLLPTRYDAVVQALGGFGALVTEAAELPAALEAAQASGLPACINVMIESVAAPVIRRPG
ncbi:hypothetical protein MRF4_00975 [Methylobacterium radiotolerans]|uniref:thiamine pyrophosphate-dependent enzyme n=1 Tax=Methylobacterium radiotolerans TaxID=31998 RepID=UPI002F336F81